MLRFLTGEWFYETKQLRHQDRIHGSDIIRTSMRHAQKLVTKCESAVSCLLPSQSVNNSSAQRLEIHSAFLKLSGSTIIFFFNQKKNIKNNLLIFFLFICSISIKKLILDGKVKVNEGLRLNSKSLNICHSY